MPIIKRPKTCVACKCAYCKKAIKIGLHVVERSAHRGKLAYPVKKKYHQICWDRKNAPFGVVGDKK